ncbi:outer membrane protein assembly factor BamE [Komagataeibacter xylinus]|uniref:Outer membrane protein assembly factor BamE n=2 Tax=Komagataeibacter xylinus TaxID=28448 RepID=A0A857FQ67_KOMXY|nr:outer membrane protein assembly factor BamE [Komagataeibacter xylinus]
MEKLLMNKIAIAGCLTAVLLVSGCASSGNTSIKNETADSIDQKIHDNVTTKQQVRAMFGDPMTTHFTDSGHEEWQYTFATTKANGTNFIPYYGAFSNGSHGKEKSLDIIYNGDVVWHHVMSSSKVKTHEGL